MSARAATFPGRSGGVLLPLASLPSRHGIGDLGPEAHRFVQWLAGARLTWWQMLPVGPVGPGDSPYSSSSAFALEPLYLSLEVLAADGLLASADLRAPRALSHGPVDYAAVRAFKLPRIEKAFGAWVRGRGAKGELDRFCAREEGWLDDLCDHEVERTGLDPDLVRFQQFQLGEQWTRLRRVAREAGVRLMGDVPIFVGAGSADARAHPELFRLDAKGRPTVLTGCPPDAFSANGQLWGHPHYAWDVHAADDFAWWRARLARQLALFDCVRIDHFIGLRRAWEVPARHRTARRGKWVEAPGEALLTSLQDELGDLPLVAEDLGAVGDDVIELRDRFGLPGMRVLQWGYDPGGYHAPWNAPENSVVYPGTHDNDTLAGWWTSLDARTRRRVRGATGATPGDVAWPLLRAAFASPAKTAIAQLQDYLALPRSARTNLPGTGRGNWSWRCERRALTRSLARRIAELVEGTGR